MTESGELEGAGSAVPNQGRLIPLPLSPPLFLYLFISFLPFNGRVAYR